MYTERNGNFSIKNVILQFLFIALFIFILVWLFPMKSDLNKALSRLMVLTESYPELKANENFLQLQGDLKDCEEKISFARQFYNDTVLSYMNKIEMFPSNIIASMFNFKKADYFEAGEEAKTAPKVSF